MSNGYRNGAFALGLVVGGGVILNLVLWSAYRANKPRKAVSEASEDPQSHPWIEPWDWFISTFVNPYDTIAQWGMALLSLAAVYLLWETLKASRKTLSATRDMAKDAREIGQAQIKAAHDTLQNEKIAQLQAHRPFLLIESMGNNYRDWREGTAVFSWEYRIENIGAGIALNIEVEAEAFIYDRAPGEPEDPNSETNSLVTSPHRFKKSIEGLISLRPNIACEGLIERCGFTMDDRPGKQELIEKVRMYSFMDYLNPILWVTVRYNDTQGNLFETSICWMASFSEGKSKPMGGSRLNYYK